MFDRNFSHCTVKLQICYRSSEKQAAVSSLLLDQFTEGIDRRAKLKLDRAYIITYYIINVESLLKFSGE
jgi:hypothetical protein